MSTWSAFQIRKNIHLFFMQFIWLHLSEYQRLVMCASNRIFSKYASHIDTVQGSLPWLEKITSYILQLQLSTNGNGYVEMFCWFWTLKLLPFSSLLLWINKWEIDSLASRWGYILQSCESDRERIGRSNRVCTARSLDHRWIEYKALTSITQDKVLALALASWLEQNIYPEDSRYLA